jgi:hypothetical protein
MVLNVSYSLSTKDIFWGPVVATFFFLTYEPLGFSIFPHLLLEKLPKLILTLTPAVHFFLYICLDSSSRGHRLTTDSRRVWSELCSFEPSAHTFAATGCFSWCRITHLVEGHSQEAVSVLSPTDPHYIWQQSLFNAPLPAWSNTIGHPRAEDWSSDMWGKSCSTKHGVQIPRPCPGVGTSSNFELSDWDQQQLLQLTGDQILKQMCYLLGQTGEPPRFRV